MQGRRKQSGVRGVAAVFEKVAEVWEGLPGKRVVPVVVLSAPVFAGLVIPGPADAANFAVLVGVDYGPANQRWANDAVQVYNALSATAGWDAGNMALLDEAWEVTPQNILNTLSAFSQRAGPQNGFLFYYSGHGGYVLEPNQEVPGEGPSPPRDAFDETLWFGHGSVIKDDDLTLSLSGFLSSVNKLVFLDACFAGGFWNGESKASPNGGNLGDLENVANTTLIAAADERSTAPGSSGITYRFIADVQAKGLSLDTATLTTLSTMFDRIKGPTGTPTLGIRKGDPNYDPSIYDPLAFTSPEVIYNTPVFASNLVPEPDGVDLVALGLIAGVVSRKRRGARSAGQHPSS
jgi:hypothetical protein